LYCQGVIVSDISQNAVAVADHYDELDPIYRRVWGGPCPSRAVGDRLRLVPGQACADIGCGYGATARRLAAVRRVSVTGFTLSAEQARYAAAHPVPDVDIHVRASSASSSPPPRARPSDYCSYLEEEP
jgi:tocopherol O-methyltransferase